MFIWLGFFLSLFISLQGNIISGLFKFHGVITTFEMIMADCPELKKVNWRCVVIDEAHRLKNRNCKLLEGLKLMNLVCLLDFYQYFFTICLVNVSSYFICIGSVIDILFVFYKIVFDLSNSKARNGASNENKFNWASLQIQMAPLMEIEGFSSNI